jgi:hypothetical protein
MITDVFLSGMLGFGNIGVSPGFGFGSDEESGLKDPVLMDCS